MDGPNDEAIDKSSFGPNDGESKGLESTEGNDLPLARSCLCSCSVKEPGRAADPWELTDVGIVSFVDLRVVSLSLPSGEADRLSSL